MSTDLPEPPLRQKLVCAFISSMFQVMATIAPIILFDNILGAGLPLAVIADALVVAFVLFAMIFEVFA